MLLHTAMDLMRTEEEEEGGDEEGKGREVDHNHSKKIIRRKLIKKVRTTKN